MSLATERLVVPITAKDKARVERKAAMAGKMSTAEFVRRAALNYEPADEEAAAELRSLVAGFEELHASTLAQLDAPTRPSMRRSRISSGNAGERDRRRVEGDQKGDLARGANHKPEPEARAIG